MLTYKRCVGQDDLRFVCQDVELDHVSVAVLIDHLRICKQQQQQQTLKTTRVKEKSVKAHGESRSKAAALNVFTHEPQIKLKPPNVSEKPRSFSCLTNTKRGGDS